MYHLSNNKSLPKNIAFKNRQGNLSHGESKTGVKQVKFFTSKLPRQSFGNVDATFPNVDFPDGQGIQEAWASRSW